jgi:hypothetical protein
MSKDIMAFWQVPFQRIGGDAGISRQQAGNGPD